MNSPLCFSVYLPLICGVLYAVVAGAKRRALPSLVDVFQIILAFSALSAGISLCVKAVDSTAKLGDLADARLSIALGGFAVVWVALTTVSDVLRRFAGESTN